MIYLLTIFSFISIVNAEHHVSIVLLSAPKKIPMLTYTIEYIIHAYEYSKGDIIIDGQDISKLNRKNLAAFRNKRIGFIFQFHHLLPEFTALENICIPAFILGTSKKEATDKAMLLLDYLNLTERKDHKPSMLSGGEQQRIAVARALINDPAIILADEPSGNLDSQSAKELHQLFFDLRNKSGQTFVIVTHNPQLAEMADKTFTMKDGVII